MDERVKLVLYHMKELQDNTFPDREIETAWLAMTRQNSPPIHDFAGARFDRLNLKGCNFTGLEMTRAVFNNCALTGAIFARARLAHAKFGVADEDGYCWIEDADFSGADAGGAEFRGDLSRATFLGAKLPAATFDGCDLQGANFSESDLNLVTFTDCNVNVATRFHEVRGVRQASMQRYALASLGPSHGGLTEGNLMNMVIVDDVALLRSEFGGVWAILHFVALAVFVAPYAWFLYVGFTTASFAPPNGQQTVSLGEALTRYILTGGVNWQHSWRVNFASFVPFVAYSIYNAARALLLWKTKKLETQQDVTRLPAKFALDDTQELLISRHWPDFKIKWRWRWFYFAVRWLFYAGLISVILNTWHFLTIRMPL
jgi:uncharacterized protein YjbI with pentapeptide repeats